MKRIFLGIDLPEELKLKIESLKLKYQLKSLPIKLVEPANSHIAVKFLDTLTEGQIDKLNQNIAVELKNFKSFEVKIENYLVFPNLDWPKVLALKVISSNLTGLATKLFHCFDGYNFIKPEDRAYTPHITLGRFKDKLSDFEKEKISNIRYEDEFKVDSIQLFESKLTGEGPIYSIINEFKLQ